MADTLGDASGGTLKVLASQSVEIIGTTDDGLFSSSLFALVDPGAMGNGGNLILETGRLLVSDGGLIATDTFGAGNAASLTVRAADIELNGTTPDGFVPSGLFASVFGTATGNGGNLTVETQRLRITGGARAIAFTEGAGNGGNLSITATEIEMIGTAPDGRLSSALSVAVQEEATGNGGNLTLETQRLRVADGAQIGASTLGFGNGGNLTVKANIIELSGSSETSRSGLLAGSQIGTGDGGNLTIAAEELIVRDRATVSVSTFNTRNLQPPGTGAAGTLEISAGSILLDNNANLNAATFSGAGGNIALQAKDMQLRRGSQITTDAGNADGGNITINTSNLVALENSDISANARAGFGGRVIVNATGIFGTQFRNNLTPKSDITASSALGADFRALHSHDMIETHSSLMVSYDLPSL